MPELKLHAGDSGPARKPPVSAGSADTIAWFAEMVLSLEHGDLRRAGWASAELERAGFRVAYHPQSCPVAAEGVIR